jgi:dicarboxylate/amino acid:cation (Na+ or H+) symporter, DAACS family
MRPTAGGGIGRKFLDTAKAAAYLICAGAAASWSRTNETQGWSCWGWSYKCSTLFKSDEVFSGMSKVQSRYPADSATAIQMSDTAQPPGGASASGQGFASHRRKLALHTKILLGLGIGAGLGILTNLLTGGQMRPEGWLMWFTQYVADPIGQVFLRMLFMVVVPLVFATLSAGVAQLGDLRKLGRVGLKAFAYFMTVTALAVAIGLALVNVIQPGVGFSPELQGRLMETYGGQARLAQEQAASDQGFGINTFVNIVPRNPIAAAAANDMLAVIFFALIFGVALTLVPREKAEPVQRLLDGLSEVIVMIVGLAMKLAPVAVAALIFSTTARFGWGVLQSLMWYVLCVIGGLLLLQFGVYSILVRVLVGWNPLWFFRKITPVMVTALSTSSSSATLPTTIKVTEEELGVPRPIAGLVLPLGATMNMNGTALFEGVTCVFLAQVFGLTLGLGQQLVVLALAVLMAVGTAGVPGGSIPLLMIVLSTIGVPPGGIAIVLGIDRVLDMCRTVPNVTGDITCACFVARSEAISPATARRAAGSGLGA